MILHKIIEKKRAEVDAARAKVPLSELKEKTRSLCTRSMFKKNISRKGHINLIAEIKRSSPSKGIIRGDFNPSQIAWEYQAAGASAISVLTDERFFDGKLEYLNMIKERVSVPVLRKDFIISEYQVYQSAANGADAILLIARLLTLEELIDYQDIARESGLDCLVEVHNEEEVEKAVKARSAVIGINNRDLSTFNVDFSNTERLIRHIPEDRIIVSESGIKSYEQIMFLKSLGVSAVLIGEILLRANNIGRKVRELLGE
ncbi:MAG: indole-3-glycerol phosphate synthase TrpC [Candidatus Omnitrophica bacterium]|nr:indole-3-glycerol phosphate synthase TrpC [Candidatus Omnitrophota bacterium]